jgi:hypothetical protein
MQQNKNPKPATLAEELRNQLVVSFGLFALLLLMVFAVGILCASSGVLVDAGM